jgi:N6-adenosine-specific RNA methylase IME4
MTTYKPHPAANLFPMMGKRELDDLANDIKERGQICPIIITKEGLVLDGRNRLAACKIAGVIPDVDQWEGGEGESPTAWVMSANLRRRHLNESQRSVVAAHALKMFEAEAKERQRLGGRPKKGSAPGRSAAVEMKSAAVAAATMGVGTRSVERAKALIAKLPTAEIDKISSGEKTLKQVEREMKRTEQVAQVKEYVPPKGAYPVIVADPPWPYEDKLDGSDAARGGAPYPTMSIDEICALQVPADKNCTLWLWVTNAHLIDGSATKVLAAWGFEPKTMLTWDKVRMGSGYWLRGVTEHCILATKGKPVHNLTNERTLLVEPRRAHSQKPDGLYSMIEQLCPATPRLEMFAREARGGWFMSGAELPKKKARRMQIQDVEGEARA